MANLISQKGTKKVGTATELPLARRAQLAVVAHIRHVYTDYDRLLKLTSFHEARGSVEHSTLAKVIEWRGDDENGQTVLEDVFREVIVISDDEDSELEEEGAPTAGHRNTSVEILPSESRAHEVRSQPISNAKALGQDPPRELSEEAPPGFRFVTRSPAKDNINRRGFNRYQAWNRALQEYREGIQGSEKSRFTTAPIEKQSTRYAEQRVTAQEAPAARCQDISPPHAEVHRRIIPASASVDNQAQRVTTIPLMDRQVAKGRLGVHDSYTHSDLREKHSIHELNAAPFKLTTQELTELQTVEEHSARNMNMAHSRNIPHPIMETRFRRERLPPQSDRTNLPIFVSGPKENCQQVTPLARHPAAVNPSVPRPGSNTQDSILPSIENNWPSETRRADGAHPLVHMTNRMSIRSVTPGRLHGEMMHHPDVIEKDGNSEQASKRRRLTCREGSRPESRPDSWSARPMGLPISDGFRPNSYQRVELLSGHRPQDQPHSRRDYPPVDQSSLVGHQRERNLIPHPGGHHINGPRESHNQAGLSSVNASILVSEGDPTFRAAPAVSNPGPWHPYHGDRSLRLNRFPKEPWTMRRTRIDGGRPLPENVQPDRNMYADGFIRHVDHRDPPPIEYVARRLESEVKPNGEMSQPTRTRNLEYLGPKHLSQTQVSSDQYASLPMNSGTAPSREHARAFSDSVAGKIQPRVRPSQFPRERSVSGEFTSLR